MAVTAAPLPKSQPDISKLNTFTGYVVTVTKHLGPRNTVGTGIISSKTMSKEALLALPEQLPSLPGAGPGYYSFSVADAGGTGDDMWLVKLGPDLPQQQESYMAGPGSNGTTPSNGFAGAPNVPMDGAAVTQILPGWYYNSALGLLYTPWRETVSWSQGEPLPKAPAHAQQSHSQLPTPSASPWGPQPGQWGGYPVNDDNSKTKQLEAQIAEMRREREMTDMRAEQRRVQDETTKRIEQQSTMFAQMFDKLASAISEIGKTPKGPSEELRAIQAQNEALQRQMEQDRRDAQAREQASQTREEMRRMKEDTDRMIASITANKSDPMLTMMMQMMSQSNQSAMEAVKAIQASTSTANTSAERQVASLVEQMRGTIISPLQMMEMMRSSRGDGAEMSKMVLETTKEMNALQRNVFEQLLDASSSGGQPPWLQAVQAAMDKIGPIGAAIAERAGQPRTVIQRVAVPVDAATGRPIQAQPQATAMAGAPAQAQVAAAPAAATAEEPAKRGRKPKKQKAGPPMTLAEIRDADPDELAEMLKAFDDETFFGETLFGLVKLVRENVGKGMLPEQVAGGLWDRRLELKALTPVPMAVELLMAEQIDVLIERLLPDVDEAFHNTVVGGIEERIAAEAEGAEE